MTIESPVRTRERRRHARVDLVLTGRYMLSDGSEYRCEIDNISPTGLSVKGERAGQFGERVVAYIDGVGRVEGSVVRRKIGWFALEVRAPRNKLERLDDRIAWLVQNIGKDALDRRGRERIDVWSEDAVALVVGGREYEAQLIDISVDGAALLVDLDLPAGTPVMLGDQTAYVQRCFPGGVAVTFELDAPSDIEPALKSA